MKAAGGSAAAAEFVVDTSALISMLFAEPTRDATLVAMAEARSILLPSCCALAATIVAESKLGASGRAELGHLLDIFAVETLPFDVDQAAMAAEAWRRFGKGRHPAGLNIIDCCSYAAATITHLPLLATGMDFARTDLPLVELTLPAGA